MVKQKVQKRNWELLVGFGLAMLIGGIVVFESAFALLDTFSIDGFVWIMMIIISVILMILGVVVTIKGLGRGIHANVGI